MQSPKTNMNIISSREAVLGPRLSTHAGDHSPIRPSHNLTMKIFIQGKTLPRQRPRNYLFGYTIGARVRRNLKGSTLSTYIQLNNQNIKFG